MTPARRCAVFDLDGTLAETAPDLVASANIVLGGEGLPPVPVSDARVTAGFGAKALIRRGYERAGREADEATVARLFPVFLEVYAQRIADESRLFDGTPEMLDALEADGWTLSVCTNKPEGLARALLEELGVLHRFAALVGADTLPVRKPDPAPLLESIARCGGVAGRAVMIGDTETDLRTARAAAVPCVLTSFGYSPDPVHGFGPDAVIAHPSELAAVLGPLLARAA